MGHNHTHAHDHSNERSPLIQPGHNHGSGIINTCSNMNTKEDSSAKSTKRRLAIATSIALVFFATELVAGYFANSLGNNNKY